MRGEIPLTQLNWGQIMWILVMMYVMAVLLIENDIRWNWSKYRRMAKWEMLVMQFCPIINFVAVGIIWRYR